MAQLNERWKDLDHIFQCLFRKYVLSKSIERFHEFGNAMGFPQDLQRFLWDALEAEMQESTNRNIHHRKHNRVSSNSNSGRKRKRIPSLDDDEASIHDDHEEEEDEQDWDGIYTDDTDDDMEEDDWLPPKRKRRKKDESQTEQQKLEARGLYMVKSILGHRNKGKKYEYRVRWVGYDDATWEPPHHLNQKMVDQYLESKGLKLNKKGAIVALDVDKAHKSRSKSKSKSKKKRSKSKSKKKKKRKKEMSDEDEKDVKVFECAMCNKSFKNGQALGGHNSAKHPKKKKASIAEEIQSEHHNEVTVIADDRDGEGSGDNESVQSINPFI
eukprot:328685_1